MRPTPSRAVAKMILDAIDRVDDVLDRLDDIALDRFGRSARIWHRDEHQRHVDFGHLLDRQQPVRERAHHDEREHDHRREDGLIDAGTGDPHKKGLLG